jgi:hypothetical protein
MPSVNSLFPSLGEVRFDRDGEGIPVPETHFYVDIMDAMEA